MGYSGVDLVGVKKGPTSPRCSGVAWQRQSAASSSVRELRDGFSSGIGASRGNGRLLSIGEPLSAAEERRESKLYRDSASERDSMMANGALRSLSSTASRSRAPRSTTGTGGGGHSEKPSKDISDWAHELEGRRRRDWRGVRGNGGAKGGPKRQRGCGKRAGTFHTVLKEGEIQLEFNKTSRF